LDFGGKINKNTVVNNSYGVLDSGNVTHRMCLTVVM